MEDWVRCKHCGKVLPISCFYTHWGISTTSKDKRQKYLKINHTCKKCRAQIRKDRINGIVHDVVERRVQEIQDIQIYKPSKTLYWVVRNLKHYGNCFVRKLRKVNLQKTSEAVGFEIKVTPAGGDLDGYILERK